MTYYFPSSELSDLFFVINYTFLPTIVKDKEAKRAKKGSAVLNHKAAESVLSHDLINA
jgi:hypothetical protein